MVTSCTTTILLGERHFERSTAQPRNLKKVLNIIFKDFSTAVEMTITQVFTLPSSSRRRGLRLKYYIALRLSSMSTSWFPIKLGMTLTREFQIVTSNTTTADLSITLHSSRDDAPSNSNLTSRISGLKSLP